MIFLVQFLAIILSFAILRFDSIRSLLDKSKSRQKQSFFTRAESFSYAININIIVSLLAIFAFNIYLYRWENSYQIYLVYLLAVLVLSELLLLITDYLDKKYLVTKFRKRQTGASIAFAIFGLITLGLAAFSYFIPTWFHNYFGNLTADQFIFLISDGGGDATADANAQVANYMAAPVIYFLIYGLKYAILPSRLSLRKKIKVEKSSAEFQESPHSQETKLAKETLISRKLKVGVKSLASLLAMILGVVYAFNTLPLMTVIKSQLNPSTFIEEHYVDPKDVLEFPDKPRNLIHIYMESVENSYYDKSIGGYDEDNLMPDLAKLNEEAIHFSNTDKLFGGPHQTYGASHSVAGMLNMGAGMSMKTAVRGGTAKPMLYPHFPTIGDILHSQGYNTEIMLGARAAWGGLGNYYVEHGDFKVFDLDYARKHGYVD